MAIATSPMLAEYNALRHAAALQVRPDAGLLLLRGADRVDFLQRMTTNNIQALAAGPAAGQSCVTVLTSPTAKIVHVFTVLAREEELWLLPARGEALALARHLRSQIFFMDNVQVEDLSSQFARMRLMGPQALTALAATGLQKQSLDDGAWQEREGLLALYQRQYDVPGFELIAPCARQAEIVERLAAVQTMLLHDAEAYHARRVELGRPLPGSELVGEYNPLEAGLGWACAENKGCYTGQEIIARMESRGKLAKRLVRLRPASPVAAGAEIIANGRPVGAITSAADGPGGPVALGYVKTAVLDEGAELTAAGVPLKAV